MSVKKINLILFIFIAVISNAQNKMIYNNTYGSNLYNYGVDGIQDKDNGYFLLANTSNSLNGNTNIHIIRTDSAGIIKWEKAIGDTSIFYSTCFERTFDRGLIITGYTNRNFLNGYDVLLIKTDSMANIQWLKTFGSSSWDFGNSVIQSKDSCFVVAGKTYGFGAKDADAYIIKVNEIGDTLWTRVFGGDSTDYASSIVNTYDDTYLIGANTKSKGAGDFDGWILNLNTNGDTIWTRTYGGLKEDILYKIINTADSAFAFCGSTRSDPAVNLDHWFVRTLKSGWVDWSLPQVWTVGSGDEAYFDVAINRKGQYAMAGYTTTYGAGLKDVFLTVMGEHYDFICSATCGTLYNENAASIGIASDSNYFMVGNTGGTEFGVNNVLFIKTGNNCQLSDSGIQHVTVIKNYSDLSSENFTLFPNPAKTIITLNGNKKSGTKNYIIRIFNSLGQQIMLKNISIDTDQISEHIDISGFSKGFYVINVRSSDTFYNSAFIIN